MRVGQKLICVKDITSAGSFKICKENVSYHMVYFKRGKCYEIQKIYGRYESNFAGNIAFIDEQNNTHHLSETKVEEDFISIKQLRKNKLKRINEKN